MRKLFLLLSVFYCTVAYCNVDNNDRFSLKKWLFGETDVRQKEEDKALELSLCDKLCPSFALYDTAGNLWTEQKVKGKITVLVIWHVFCQSCLKELPVMNDMVKQHPGMNFLAMTINTDEQVNKALVTKTNSFIHLTNALPFISKIGVIATPTKLVLDKRGIIRYIIRGGEEKQQKLLIKKLKELSKE